MVNPCKWVRYQDGTRYEHYYTEEEKEIIRQGVAEGKTRQEIRQELNIVWPYENKEENHADQ